MTVYICIIYKFRIFDIGEAERLKTKQLMMILISKQIRNSLHPSVWLPPSVARLGSRFCHNFSLSFRKFVKSPVQWERRTDQCWSAGGWPIPCSPGVSCHTGDHWHVLTIDSPWARDTPLTSTGHPWHVPPATDHSSPLTTGDGHCSPVPGDWSLLFAAPLSSLMSPLWLPLPLIVMQIKPLSGSQLFVPASNAVGQFSSWILRNGKQRWRLN